MALRYVMATQTKYLQLLLVVCNLISFSTALKAPERYESRRISKPSSDMAAASSVAVPNYKIQSVASPSAAPAENRRYGYPFLIAPTLPPFISARSDDDENEAARGPLSPAKTYDSDEGFKKGSQKKHKVPYTYGATRRQGYDDSEEDASLEKRYRNYREPKYRNFDELEISFRPRRIDVGIPYSEYDYPKSSRRPVVSPRDPYLSPNGGHSDSFYPSVPKVVGYSSSYPHGDREVPSYGAGKYDDPHDYHSEHIHGGYTRPTSKYPLSSNPYGYHEDYAIESNKPIIGDIRKRLLDYAGASDLYEGEPDYLREVARNKHKYGNLGNDYYMYSGPAYRSSYRDFPYVESKVRRVVKKSRV